MSLPKARGVGRVSDQHHEISVYFDRSLTDDELRELHELLAGRLRYVQREPDGYALVLDDKNAPKGFWFAVAYHSKETAEQEAARKPARGERVIPFYFDQPGISVEEPKP